MTPPLFDSLRPGTPAPDFMLHAVQHDRTVSLSDYRGRSQLLLGIFVGLYCPFCRRAIAEMSKTAQKLQGMGIDSLAVVATELDNARLYFRYRPTTLPLAVDPDLTTHRSYGVPRPELTPEFMDTIGALRINPTGELPAPMGVEAAARELDKLDGFVPTPTDQRESEHQFPQLKGQFLIDRDGVIRWVNIECAEGPAGIGKFPAYEGLLAAAQVTSVRL